MASQPQTFRVGDAITAQRLNTLVAAAKRSAGASGAPGATIAADRQAALAIRVYVIGRAISVPGVLEAHAYTVTDGANEWDIDWTELIVEVQPDLVGPGISGLAQGFVPAEIAGQGRALSEPWRSWGLLYRGPAPDDSGDQVAAVKLFGLVPHRGC